MKKDKYIPIIISLLGSYIIVYQQITVPGSILWIFKESYIDVIIYSFAFVILVISIIYSIRLFNRRKSIIYLFPSIIFGISLIATLVYNQFIRKEYYYSPTILEAQYDISPNKGFFEIRKNGTYKIYNQIESKVNIDYGSYSLRGDTIILDDGYPFQCNKIFITNKLIVQSDSILLYFDKVNKKIPNQMQFKVSFNNLISIELTKSLIGEWKVVESNLLPFTHISFCNDLGINSIFEFNKDGSLKVYRKIFDICNCNWEQSFWTDSLNLVIFEHDVGYTYEILKLKNDTLILKNTHLPDELYKNRENIQDTIELKESYKGLEKDGIIIKLTKITGGNNTYM